jgi:hypothetical protein
MLVSPSRVHSESRVDVLGDSSSGIKKSTVSDIQREDNPEIEILVEYMFERTFCPFSPHRSRTTLVKSRLAEGPVDRLAEKVVRSVVIHWISNQHMHQTYNWSRRTGYSWISQFGPT